MKPEVSPDLRKVLHRPKLGPLMATLPERVTLARSSKIPYEDFLLQVLSDEVSRRDHLSAESRARRGHLDPRMVLDTRDETGKVTYDRQLWAELCTLRFLDSHHQVLILGPVGVGKTFLANALGHIACHRGRTVLASRADLLLKQLKAAPLDNSYDAEMRRLIAIDLLILDDFDLDRMDPMESRDVYDILGERHLRGSIIVMSKRMTTPAGPLRGMAFPDPVA